ncbi:hypothetical protein SK128_025214 [Halocaridina rubra]|uniref:Uncharacterized protein n=1 Tax=Halocaridina rubra TaxID=373956 RepID=A0AAN8XU19_HALRR
MEWACLLLCLMSAAVSSAKWIFPDHDRHVPLATDTNTGSAGSSSSSYNSHSHIIINNNNNNNNNNFKHSDGSLSLASVYDTARDLDIDGFHKKTAKNFNVNSSVRRLRYGLKLPKDVDNTLYGLKVPPPPLPPSPPPPRPKPLVYATSTYNTHYDKDVISQSTTIDLNQVVQQYNPPFIHSEAFSPSISYESREAFQPSTYFILTEAAPQYVPSAHIYKETTVPPFKYHTTTTTFKPVVYKNNPSPKRHATVVSSYSTLPPYTYDEPSRKTYETNSYKYQTPVTYEPPHTYKYNTPESYKYQAPDLYKYNTPAPYQYDPPPPYRYDPPATYKSHTSSYDSHKVDTKEPYKHEKAKKYDYRYNVGSLYHGTAYRHQEKSDGDTVHGEYRVRLPDGRLQVVTYTADHENGYVPTVRYEGPQTVEAADIHFQPPTPTKMW